MTITISKPVVPEFTNMYVIEYPDIENIDMTATIMFSSNNDPIEVERAIRHALADLESHGIVDTQLFWYAPDGKKMTVKLIPNKELPKKQLLQE